MNYRKENMHVHQFHMKFQSMLLESRWAGGLEYSKKQRRSESYQTCLDAHFIFVLFYGAFNPGKFN